MRSDQERLLDIEEAIAKNELIQTWVLFQFQVIGEAARSLSNDTRTTYTDVVLQDMIDFRNLLVHEYFRVDLKLVWSIVERQLPILKAQIAEILANGL